MFRANKSFFRTQKRDGKISVTKQVQKVYLRTDIPCGVNVCAVCAEFTKGDEEAAKRAAVLAGDAEWCIVPDTNVILHNIDAIEAPAITNVVILDTVLQEVKNLNRAVYGRLAKLIQSPENLKRFYVFSNQNHVDTASQNPDAGESPNDHNDRLIRTAAKWYQVHLEQAGIAVPVYLLTHDRGNAEKAVQLGLRVATMPEFVATHLKHDKSLIDTIQAATPASNDRERNKQAIYTPYVAERSLRQGLDQGKYLQGALRQGSNMHEGSVSVTISGGEAGSKAKKQYAEYLIPSKAALNRCLDGDTVAIRVLPVEDWTKPSRFLRKDERVAGPSGVSSRPTAGTSDMEDAKAKGFVPTAEVVGLVQNNRRPVCGTVIWDRDTKSTSQVERVLFRPVRGNVPYIRLQTRQIDQWAGKRLQVVIDTWSENSPYPDGHCVKVLGAVGDKDVEAEVILLENDVPHYDFSQAVLDCLPQGEWHVAEGDVGPSGYRRDFRNKCVVSVDPPGCKDIDDALHCEQLPNGNYEVGVHIADVTHFMKEGTPLDAEAAKRSTSVYLVDRRIDMLPKLLTENLCSLVGGEERYTFSCVWELTPDARVVSSDFTKGVIKSRSAMTYYKAQEIVNDPSDQTDIGKGLKGLLHLSQILKKRRVEDGALTLASQEMKFTMDMEDGNRTTDVSEYVHIPTMSMIEEFMLFANVAVAQKIERNFPKWACLRRHPPPNDGSMDPLNEALEAQNMPKLDATTSRRLADTLDACNDANDPYFNRLVRILVTRNMQQAKYFSSGEHDKQQYWHYGLAMPIYTHFTSPIRRYADVIVHRQLQAAIGQAKVSSKHMEELTMQELTENMNYRHTLAQHAGRDSRNLHIGYVFDTYRDTSKKIADEDAYVTRVMDNGVSVMVPRYGTEGTVFFDDSPELQQRKMRQLDKVRVRITLRAGSNDDVSRNKLLYEVIQHVGVSRVAAQASSATKVEEEERAKQAAKLIEDECRAQAARDAEKAAAAARMEQRKGGSSAAPAGGQAAPMEVDKAADAEMAEAPAAAPKKKVVKKRTIKTVKGKPAKARRTDANPVAGTTPDDDGDEV
eukprot:TRINITY_DN895_c6_g1_i1.p1 TRINITY_DN895_c6_g1~~TRINITY_DN895_c6_g1_i1.p1  ORF type:complete len:1075 (+),score=463.79 TRINITY_DN895_c6_g1_i1:82-3306(+)